MPLDSHQYLVKQGWGGKGTALRHGSLVRPIAIPQKRTLAGVGKDRDEAFPFWDHLFTVSAKTIQIKVHRDSDEESCSEQNESAQTTTAILARTKTGILSNKRPISGTPASTSGTSTPSTSDSSSTSQASNISLLSLAKREAAKRSLYIRFYRGPVLGPDIPSIPESQSSNVAGPSSGVGGPSAAATEIVAKESGKEKEKESRRLSKKRVEGEAVEKELAKEKSTKSRKDKSKKRKLEDGSRPVESNEVSPDEVSRSRKKKRKNISELSSGPSSANCATPTDSLTLDPAHKSTSDSIEISSPPAQPDTIPDPKADKAARKAEKRKRKEEKEARRAEREVRSQRKRERKAKKERSG